MQGKGESYQKEERSGDSTMERPVLSKIHEACQTHRREQHCPSVSLGMFQMQNGQPQAIENEKRRNPRTAARGVRQQNRFCGTCSIS